MIADRSALKTLEDDLLAATQEELLSQLAAVRRFYTAAQAWGLRADNPAIGLKAKRQITSRAQHVEG